jgi:hypothetical protein
VELNPGGRRFVVRDYAVLAEHRRQGLVKKREIQASAVYEVEFGVIAFRTMS